MAHAEYFSQGLKKDSSLEWRKWLLKKKKKRLLHWPGAICVQWCTCGALVYAGFPIYFGGWECSRHASFCTWRFMCIKWPHVCNIFLYKTNNPSGLYPRNLLCIPTNMNGNCVQIRFQMLYCEVTLVSKVLTIFLLNTFNTYF